MTPGKGKYTTDMVAVFVGNQNPRQLFRSPLQTGKSPERFALTEAAIDHQAGCAALDQQRVPCAAAAKRREAYHCNCW
jgi:hypothetical protein